MSRIAFPVSPSDFPETLLNFQKPDPGMLEPSCAVTALQSATDNASDFGEAVWVCART